jgi:hypothetical protein
MFDSEKESVLSKVPPARTHRPLHALPPSVPKGNSEEAPGAVYMEGGLPAKTGNVEVPGRGKRHLLQGQLLSIICPVGINPPQQKAASTVLLNICRQLSVPPSPGNHRLSLSWGC